MERKAISDFRWTTVEEIVRKGGALKLISKEEYCGWFDTLSEEVQKRMIDAWGNPPGEEINGVPAAMVCEGKIVVTGVRFGNAVVCVQPKRGCAGARCDGQVCRILHEPGIVPPHQYMAVYKYLEQDFGADAIVHVGTHGNLEFLPGKGVGLSSDCFPDLAIGDMPHLYIYNSDNPPEGVIAKRRSLATIVDHMQTVMNSSGLYDELEELDRVLAEYEKIKGEDRTRDHLLQHQIIDTIRRADLDHEIKVSVKSSDGIITYQPRQNNNATHDLPFDEMSEQHITHFHASGTPIFRMGCIYSDNYPKVIKVDFIHSIMRYDADRSVSLRQSTASMMA